MSKERKQDKRWIIWWIYGNGSQKINVYVHKIRIIFGRRRLLGARIEQFNLFKSTCNLHYKSERINYFYIPFSTIYKMANINSSQPPPMQEQVQNKPNLGTQNPLGLLEHLSEQEMAPSPVASSENDDNFLGIFYHVDVDSLIDWATVTQFTRGSIGYVVQEPIVTEDFKHILIIMYGSNWEQKWFWLTKRWLSSKCMQWEANLSCEAGLIKSVWLLDSKKALGSTWRARRVRRLLRDRKSIQVLQ